MIEIVYVDRLFADYNDTQELRDFKEEIAVNLSERVKEFVSKGLTEDAAFEKAAAELGDITVIADTAAKQKRTETIGQMYMKAKVTITKRTAAGLTVATAFLLFAAGVGLVNFFGKSNETPYYLAAALLSVAAGLYTYFGLSQETAAHYAVKKGRAVTYGVIALLGVLGAGLAIVSFLTDGWEISASIGIKAALILPAICVLIFMLSTEPKRQKPWLKAMIDRDIEASMSFHSDMVDPVKAARFGVASGALWLFAIALCVTLGIFVNWNISWLPPLFALPVQVLMTVSIFKKGDK
jgi:cytochrome c oxidase subunit IV